MSRVVVVGGGIVGLCSARELAMRGHEVVVLERQPRAHRGCSWGNLGMIVPSHFEPLAAPGVVPYGLKMLMNPESPFGFRAPPSAELVSWGTRFWRSATHTHVERSSPVVANMHLASLALYRELIRELRTDVGFVEHGLLALCKTSKRLDAEAALAHTARGYGLDVDVLDAQALREREPGVDFDVAGAVHYRNDAHLQPDHLMVALAADVESRGVEIRYGCNARGLTRRGGTVLGVDGPDGRLVEGDHFVLAGGVETARLARAAGLDLPLIAGKGYTMTVPHPPQAPQACVILAEAHVAATPMPDGFRIGGTMEIGASDLSVNLRRVAGIRRSFCSYFPAFSESSFEGVPVWAGRRPLTPDGLPCIGRAPDAPNCVAACGHAMMGLSLGPITGRIVAQVIGGEATDVPIDLFRPERFG